MNISRICLAGVLALLTISSFAQTKKAFVKAGEEALLKKDFHAALVYFQSALRYDSTQLDILYNTAQAARSFNAYKAAEKLYQGVLDIDSTNSYPETQYWLGEMKQKLGKYDEALDLFQLYISENDNAENYLANVAKKEILACEWSKTVAGTEREDVVVTSMTGAINTPYSEFGAFKNGDDLYYSSLRFERPGEKKEAPKLFSKILKKSPDSAEGEALDDDLNDPVRHTAHSAFNKKKDRLYYTICDYINTTDIRCDLYYVEKEGDKWGTPVRLPSTINVDSTTSTQPNVGSDKITGKEVLYFVSDRDGGEGGLDIWAAPIEADGTLGPAQNVEDINSPYDDITPFYHNLTNTLYFSSAGWQGLGGFDVFKSKQSSKGWGEVKHLGNLINTSYNDVYFSLDSTGETGLISSNREGSLYLEEAQEACCYDIYDVDFKASRIELLAKTFDRLDQSPLAGAMVTLYDLTDPDSDPVMTQNLEGNDFVFLLEQGHDYKVIADKEGYEPDSLLFNTRNIFKNEQIAKNLFLKSKTLDLEILAYDKLTQEPLIGATVTVIDLSDSMNVPLIITNPDGNNFIIPLDRGNQYRIIVSKKGYTPETFEINTDDFENENKVSRKVYLTRGDLESFLPLILFFDNDYPEPQGIANSRYSNLFENYYNRKKEFIDTYTKAIKEGEKVEIDREYERFFEDRVLKGNVDLDQFLDILSIQLQQGETIEIFLKGYASPLATEQYNFRLGERRVTNVLNEINFFKDGILKPYISSGQLTVSQKSFGETTSPAGISDLIEDPRNSIFSIPASNERRVEIVQIKRSDN